MAKKRFTDIEIWDKEWFMDLDTDLKCLVKYLFDICDPAGVWTPNWRLTNARIKPCKTLTENDLLSIDGGRHFEKMGNKIFIPDFINFQYGNLSEECKPHKQIFALLEKYGLKERVLKGYTKGIKTQQEKDKEKEKEKEMEKEKEDGEKRNEKFLIPEMQKTWKKHKPNYPPDIVKDFTALRQIAVFICEQASLDFYRLNKDSTKSIHELWETISSFVATHKFFKNYSLYQVEKHIQSITQEIQDGQSNYKNGNQVNGKVNGQQLHDAVASFYSSGKQN